MGSSREIWREEVIGFELVEVQGESANLRSPSPQTRLTLVFISEHKFIFANRSIFLLHVQFSLHFLC